MMITEVIFLAFLNCETKSYLKSSGETGQDHEFSNWQRHIAYGYEQQCRIHLRARFPDDECLVGVTFSQDLAKTKYRLLIDCSAQAQQIQSRIHALERSAFTGNSRENFYIPIRFVPTDKITRSDRLMLAFDALALFAASGKTPAFGKLIHGSGHKTVKVPLAELMKSARIIVERITRQQASQTPPPLVLNKHCPECEFQYRCRQLAIEKDELSLLAGVTEKERKKQHDKGIFSITQLSYTFRPRRRAKGKDTASRAEKNQPAIRALAIREQKIHIAGRPEIKTRGTPVCLDVEGVQDQDFYYLIGMRIKKGDSFVQHSLWANDKSEEKSIYLSFMRILAEIENPQLIHYGSYESVFLKRMKERYNDAIVNPTFIDQFMSDAVNVLSVIYGQIYFPTYTNGLIASDLTY